MPASFSFVWTCRQFCQHNNTLQVTASYLTAALSQFTQGNSREPKTPCTCRRNCSQVYSSGTGTAIFLHADKLIQGQVPRFARSFTFTPWELAKKAARMIEQTSCKIAPSRLSIFH